MSRTWKIVIGSSVGLVIIIAGIVWYFTSRPPEPPRTIAVETIDIVQDVEFTGRLQSKQSAKLSFESTGTIAELLVTEGQTVNQGDPIASLDPALSELELAKVTADQLSSAEQKQLAFADAQRNATNTKTLNQQTLEKKRQAVRDAKIELDQARNVHNETDQESGDSAATATALATLRAKESAYNAAQESLTESTKSVKQTNDAAAAAVKTAEAAYLATVQASGGNASLASLEALREISRVKLARRTIRAPFDGVITNHHHELGETVLAGNTVTTIETVDSLELSADTTETDAAKIRSGMTATITFDALPQQDQWEAELTYVAPAATTIEGVPTYETKLLLTSNDNSRLKPGLTANITVHADRRENVFGIPRRAVIVRGTEQYVLVLNADQSVTEQAVTTGLVGTDGNIEITSGLTEGQQVIIDTVSLRESR